MGSVFSRITAIIVMACSASVVQAYDDVTPTEAYAMATTDANVYLLDVRTEGEWTWVGHPGENRLGDGAALAGKVVNISYKIDHKNEFVINPSFISDVDELFESNPNVELITMCRSGKRSRDAAAALESAGYTAHNLASGFEGSSDAKGYRTVNGWKVDGFPYTTSGVGYQD